MADLLGIVNPWQHGKWDKKVLSDRAHKLKEITLTFSGRSGYEVDMFINM